MPAAIAVPGLIGLGTSIAGGIMGSGAAKDAAKVQSEAAERAAADLLRVIGEQNPELWKAYEQGTGRVTAAAEGAATGVEDAARRATEGVTGATTEANRLLNPYIEAGTSAVTQLGDLANERFVFNQDDPSYQFRLQEGQKALERNRAAQGIISGGRPLKELTRYSQDYASTEYGKAFDRFLQTQQQRAGTLGQLAGFGLTAGTTAGGNLVRGAEYGGNIGFDAARTAGGLRTDAAQFGANAQMNTAGRVADNNIQGQIAAGGFRTDAAAARGAGKVGSANAWTGALGGIANVASDVGGMLTLRDLLKNPAARRPKVTISGYRLSPQEA